jgi:hypothetical protein
LFQVSDVHTTAGTVIWTSPSGEKYVTHPGSALIFPTLWVPTGPVTNVPQPAERGGDKTAMMPRRQRTHTQRAAAITAERRANYEHRTNPQQPHHYDEDYEYLGTFTFTTTKESARPATVQAPSRQRPTSRRSW